MNAETVVNEPQPVSWAFSATAPLPGTQSQPPPRGEPAPRPACHRAEPATQPERTELAATVRELRTDLERLADRLRDPQQRPESLLGDLIPLASAVTRCCRLLETSAADHSLRADRRMVQATGLAEMLTVRLTDAFAAQQYSLNEDTPV
jgi:hypothetical protein